MTNLMKRLLAIVLVTFVMLGMGFAINAEAAGPVWEKGIKKSQDQWVVGATLPEFKHNFFAAQMQGILDAGKKYGFKVEVRDGENDPAKQGAIIDEFIVKKVDCILLCPIVKGAMVSAVRRANQAGIPVMILNRTLGDGAETIAYVGANDYTGGLVQGELVAETLAEKKGNVILLQGNLGSSPQINREKGLEDYLAAYPDIKIIRKYPCDFDRSKALAAMQDALIKYPKGQIDMVVSQDSEMCMTALQAIKAAGRTELLGKIVAFDYPSYVKQNILSGDFKGTVLQDPYQQSMIGMDAVWFYLSGNEGHIPKPNFFTPLPKVVKSNAEGFPPSW
jgi:ribose transport system substrate-binding protein